MEKYGRKIQACFGGKWLNQLLTGNTKRTTVKMVHDLLYGLKGSKGCFAYSDQQQLSVELSKLGQFLHPLT